MKKIGVCAQKLLDKTTVLEFLGPLALRLYLVPIFWMAGTNKLSHFDNTVQWFGNAQWGLGMPFPTLMACLAIGAEIIGAIGLLFGLGTRWVSIPLMITMIVAAVTVHLQNGWLAIAHESSMATQRLSGFMQWLQNEFPGRHEFITQHGQPVILNNGIEFAVTYFIMLLVLFFIGGGKYISMDYWIRKKWMS